MRTLLMELQEKQSGMETEAPAEVEMQEVPMVEVAVEMAAEMQRD